MHKYISGIRSFLCCRFPIHKDNLNYHDQENMFLVAKINKKTKEKSVPPSLEYMDVVGKSEGDKYREDLHQ